jgi:hypothetical protein
MFLNSTFSPLVKTTDHAVHAQWNLKQTEQACAVDLHEKVAQVSFQSTSVQGLLKMAAMGEKCGFLVEKVPFKRALSLKIPVRSWRFPATFIV